MRTVFLICSSSIHQISNLTNLAAKTDNQIIASADIFSQRQIQPHLIVFSFFSSSDVISFLNVALDHVHSNQSHWFHLISEADDILNNKLALQFANLTLEQKFESKDKLTRQLVPF